MRENLASVEIIGISITAEKKDKILEFILRRLKENQKKLFILTHNPEIMTYAQAHPSFKTILNRADIALPDGSGVVLAAKLLGKSIRTRLTGVDFMEELCEHLSKQHTIVGFLGGRGNVAAKTAECLKRKYPGLKVSFAVSELSELEKRSPEVSSSMYYVVSNKSKSTKILNTKYKIPATDFLFVAFGFPKQEEWIHENLDRLPVKAAMGVGGSFDFLSGEVSRAPRMVRFLGLEWLFRLVLQPWRIKRQMALATFAWLVFKEKFRQ